MANVKKTETQKKIDVKSENRTVSLTDVGIIVNTVVDSVFVERNGKTEFSSEIYEVLLAYLEIGSFYPETKLLEDNKEKKTPLNDFFMEYIDGKYQKELDELKNNRLAQYIENAVKTKIDAKMRQLESPTLESVANFFDVATALAQKYINDIDNVGMGDIKTFLQDFAKFAKKTNPQSITDTFLQIKKGELTDSVDTSNITLKPITTKPKTATRKTTAKK